MENTTEIDIPQVANITKKQQVIAVLSTLSNCNQNGYEISEAALQEKATTRITAALKDSTLTKFIGNWELVWGPCLKNSIIKKTLTNPNPKHLGQYVTDNTMYVAKSQDPEDPTKTLYVVAVAGTNAISGFGWKDEDGRVLKMIDWKGVPNAKISQGSSDGLDILLKMNDNNKSLLQFLSTIDLNKNVEIATCGHSLGGALSPLVALKLVEMKETNKFFNLTVSCYPSAGPTSGNAELARYAEEKLANNYHSVINNYDIVPHAWNVGDLKRIPKLYSSAEYGNLKLSPVLTNDIAAISLLIKLKNYTRINNGKEFTFDGKPKTPNDQPLDSVIIPMMSKINQPFFHQAAYQHTTVYNQPNAFNFPADVSAKLQEYIQPKTGVIQ
ncbi:lipase family protein [Flavobacterium sp. ZT3R18]|uniref:lipase family protein n=1 Tax=Flavobacterium sp. ZT3R18 TaxID=2594429 RepID=UPI00117B89E2|nr:lipase family protein [Flavobacterium sp. ZT3R18]TRX32385.1 lipase family protein [Flavobacterium sp. ZT3R18]